MGKVRRVYAEKKKQFAVPARQLRHEIRHYLGISGVTDVRVLIRYDVENISDSNFTIDRLCREMAMSRTLFYVKLKSYTGKSPQDFIRIIRLERAATLLRNGRQVTDVATMTGFDNPKYFSTVFKKYFGVSPSKYQ